MAKQTITITLYMSELVFDVQNKTYLTGRSRTNGENFEQVANMQADDEEENSKQILRSIGNAYGSLMAKLSEYVVSDKTTATNLITDQEANLTIALQMPGSYNKAANEAVVAAVHQYIVNTAIADWFVITNKPDAVDYVNLAAVNITQLREALNKRVRPVRPAIV